MRFPLLAVVAIGAACTGEPAPANQAAPAKLMTDILEAQTARTRQIHDFTITGTASSVNGTQKVQFTLAFEQPGKLRSTLDDGSAKVDMVFDGKVLMAVDHTHKVAQQKDLSALPPDDQLMVVMQAFGRLFCEGWRTPLLSPRKTQPAIIGGRDTLVVQLDDNAVKEERYFFKSGAPHDFDGRSTLDNTGKEVAFLKVLERKDEAGMSFPTTWEKQDASGHTRFALSDTQVNKGLDASLFSTTPPADVTVVQ